jgi:hypothetical protein
LASQLLTRANKPKQHPKPSTSSNYHDILADIMTTEDVNSSPTQANTSANDDSGYTQSTNNSSINHPPPVSWKIDSTISDLSNDIFTHINAQKNSPE